MRKWAGLILVLAAVLGGLLWFARPVRAPLVAPRERPIAVSEETAPIAETPPAKKGTPEPAKAPTEGISGWILSLDDGTPVSGVSVLAFWREEGDRRETTVATDDDGSFLFAGLDPGRYTIEAVHDELVSEHELYPADLSEDAPWAELEIWMQPGGAVSGRVYDAATGDGIAGVAIGIGRKRTPGTTTDADGGYRIEAVRAGEREIHYLKARGYRFPPTHADGLDVTVVAREEGKGFDIALQKGVFAVIEGIVVDPDGDPMKGVDVSASRRNDSILGLDPPTSTSGPDGSFLLNDLEVSDGYFLYANADGYRYEAPEPVALTADGLRGVVITMTPVSRISGVVVDLDGNPIEDSDIHVQTLTHFRGANTVGRYQARVGDGGAFTLDELTEGTYGLFVAGRSMRMSGIVEPQVTVELGIGEHVEGVRLEFDYARYADDRQRMRSEWANRRNAQQVQRPAETDFEGQVVRDATGEPLTDFTLQTIESKGGGFQMKDIHDEDGRFEATKREGRDLRVIVSAKGYSPGDVTLGDADVLRPVVVRLRKGAVIEGEVVNALGEPVAGASIYIGHDPQLMDDPLYSIPGVRPSDAVSMNDGTFTIDTLSDEPETLYATHPSYAKGMTTVSPSRSQVTTATIVMPSGGSVEGNVSLAGGGIAGRTIMVQNDEGTNIDIVRTPTNGDGWYRIDRLTPGRYTFYTTPNDDRMNYRIQFRDAQIAEGAVTVVDFDFTGELGRLEGVVRVGGTPVYAFVNLEISSGIIRHTLRTATDESGNYVLPDVPVGAADVTVNVADANLGRFDEKFSITIHPGESQRQNFDLQR